MTWSQGPHKKPRQEQRETGPEIGLEIRLRFMARGPCRRQATCTIGLRSLQETVPKTDTPMIKLRQELKDPG